MKGIETRLPSYEETAMSDNPATHARNEEYTFQVPNPPRVIIPPTIVSTPDTLDLYLGPVVPAQDSSLNVDFLDSRFAGHDLRFQAVSWEYSKRREPQSILPFLYLGPSTAARDRGYLTREGITMILGVQPRNKFGALMMKSMSFVADQLEIKAAWLEASDNQTLIHELPVAIKAINAHLVAAHRQGRSGKVLVFCESGNDRSAAVVAAYLIETFSAVDVVKAIQICGSRRFCCGFDDNTKHLLSSYESIVHAKRSVAGVNLSSLQLPMAATTAPGGGHKRSRDDENSDVDMDDEDEDDDERFIGRAVTPFQ